MIGQPKYSYSPRHTTSDELAELLRSEAQNEATKADYMKRNNGFSWWLLPNYTRF